MTYTDDYGLDAPCRLMLILALALPDREGGKEMDILHLQKVINYFEYLRQKREVDFSNFNLGGVSYELADNLESLNECGLIKKQGSRYELTGDGAAAVKELFSNTDKQELKKMEFAKYQLNDLSSDELMFFMYNLLPDTQANSAQVGRLIKKKAELSNSLFLKGRINVATASKWSGLPESKFLS